MNKQNFLLNLQNNLTTILSRTRRQAAVATDTRTAGCTRRASTTLTSRPTHMPPENAESVSAALEKIGQRIREIRQRNLWRGLYEEAGGGGDGGKNNGLYTACQYNAHQPTHAHPARERRVGQRSPGKIRQKIRQKSADNI
jgi:hypothetical protein